MELTTRQERQVEALRACVGAAADFMSLLTEYHGAPVETEYLITVEIARALLKAGYTVALEYMPKRISRSLAWDDGKRFGLDSHELTFDHVIPRARGGHTSWENLVPACAPCNTRKRDLTPAQAGMPLRRPPYHPTRLQLNEIGHDFLRVEAMATSQWLSWLYWKGVELEP